MLKCPSSSGICGPYHDGTSSGGRRRRHVDGGDGGRVGDGGGQGPATGAVAIVVQPVGMRVRRGPGGGELHRQSKHSSI